MARGDLTERKLKAEEISVLLAGLVFFGGANRTCCWYLNEDVGVDGSEPAVSRHVAWYGDRRLWVNFAEQDGRLVPAPEDDATSYALLIGGQAGIAMLLASRDWL